MTDLRIKLIRLAHENPSLRSDILPLLKESSAASKEWEVVSVPEAKRLKDEAKKQGLKIRSRASGSTIMVQVEDGVSFSKVHELAKSLFPAPKFKVKPPLMDSSTGFEIQLQQKALEGAPKEAAKKLNEKELDKALASHQKGQGIRIVNKDNPSWGEWQVTKKTTHDGTSWFDIRGDRGSRTLSIDEAEDHWELASQGKSAADDDTVLVKKELLRKARKAHATWRHAMTRGGSTRAQEDAEWVATPWKPYLSTHSEEFNGTSSRT